MAELTVDQAGQIRVWRVGFKPEPWAWAGWEWATNGRFPGRWDDRNGNFRTVYAGSTMLACLLEVLADFRPDSLVVGGLDDIVVDAQDEAAYPTAAAGTIDPTWLEPRAAATATLSGRFCWITTHDSVAALHADFVGQALRLGVDDREHHDLHRDHTDLRLAFALLGLRWSDEPEAVGRGPRDEGPSATRL